MLFAWVLKTKKVFYFSDHNCFKVIFCVQLALMLFGEFASLGVSKGRRVISAFRFVMLVLVSDFSRL